MSVIVTGIEMPKSCVRCDLCDSGGYCRALQRQTDKNVNERYKRCPLKSVDGLVERINKLAYSETEYGIEEFDASKIVRLDDLIEVIKEYCGMEDAE